MAFTKIGNEASAPMNLYELIARLKGGGEISTKEMALLSYLGNANHSKDIAAMLVDGAPKVAPGFAEQAHRTGLRQGHRDGSGPNFGTPNAKYPPQFTDKTAGLLKNVLNSARGSIATKVLKGSSSGIAGKYDTLHADYTRRAAAALKSGDHRAAKKFQDLANGFSDTNLKTNLRNKAQSRLLNQKVRGTSVGGFDGAVNILDRAATKMTG